MKNLELIKFLCGTHPARRLDFDNLLDGILSRSERTADNKPLINISKKDGLILANYTHECVFSQSWDEYTCISRGLILHPESKMVVATPFPKFFNWGESGLFWLPEQTKMVSNIKVDGCLGIIYYFNNKWRIASRGSLDSDVSQAGQIILDNSNTNCLNKGYTYIVEIIHRDHRILIPYDYDDLVLLAAYDDLGNEVSLKDIPLIAKEMGIRYAYGEETNSVEEIIEKVADMPYTEEGFVIRFSNGYRVKIKSKAYLEKHKTIFTFGPLRVWELMLNKESLNDYKMTLPEEFWEEFDLYKDTLENEYQKRIVDIEIDHEKTRNLPDEILGRHIKSMDLTEAGRKYLFAFRRGKFYNEIENKDSPIRNKFFKLFRPKNNSL